MKQFWGHKQVKLKGHSVRKCEIRYWPIPLHDTIRYDRTV